MDFADRIAALSARVKELRELTTSEEATKTSLILPFLQSLGYDAFDPRVVIPEFTADVGSKKGEKVDYAIKRNGEIIMLIEAKCAGDALDASKASQLHRYFHTIPSAKIGILTDGVRYKFFTDLEKENIMDEKPFMIFDFMDPEKALVAELKKLCNDCFDVEVALAAAKDLKYLRIIKNAVAEEMQNPSDEIVRFFAKKAYSESLRANILESFKGLVKTAFEHHINDVINARLQGAIQPNTYATTPLAVEETPQAEAGKPTITTNSEEIEGFLTVKAILREIIDPSRVFMRDTQSYCGIILDDTQRKQVCRLYFNSPTVKYLEIFTPDKKTNKYKIETLNDIYKHGDEIKSVVLSYDIQ